MTHVSVKALRHYHDVGLLEPAAVDPDTGYRFYAVAQIPTAQVIRRFRELDMPIEQVKAVLSATDATERDAAIVAHLRRMEEQLEQTNNAVAGLRELLDGSGETTIPIAVRSFEPVVTMAIHARVEWDAIEGWLDDALAEVDRVVGERRAGPDGGLYSSKFFESHYGAVTAFVPVDGACPASGRVERLDLAPARYAITVHKGPFSELDRTYSALGTFVYERGIAADGPIRENYLTPDTTEVCWPVA
jgi:DNA-binding transcriptional MerR regulator/effector-binding domain-containing protein